MSTTPDTATEPIDPAAANETALAIVDPSKSLAPPKALGMVPTQAEIDVYKGIADVLIRSRAALPKDCRTRDAIMLKLLFGWELGLRPMASIWQLQNIDGNIGPTALAMCAIVAQRGIGTIKTLEVADTHATVRVSRKDWAKGKTVDMTWGESDAIAAGYLQVDATTGKAARDKAGLLVGKKNYRERAGNMYLARARSEAWRRYFEDQCLGLPYSAEEMADERGLSIDFSQGSGPVIDVVSEAVPPPAASAVPPAASPPSATTTPSTATTEAKTPGVVTDPPPWMPQTESAHTAEPAADPVRDVLAQVDEDHQNPLITGEKLKQIADYKTALGWDAEVWRKYLARWKLTTVKTARQDTVGHITRHMGKLVVLKAVRETLKVPPEMWAKALNKRNATHESVLSCEAADELLAALTEKLTEVQRAACGIGVAVDPDAGKSEPA